MVASFLLFVLVIDCLLVCAAITQLLLCSCDTIGKDSPQAEFDGFFRNPFPSALTACIHRANAIYICTSFQLNLFP
jgi:hypothetical protein